MLSIINEKWFGFLIGKRGCLNRTHGYLNLLCFNGKGEVVALKVASTLTILEMEELLRYFLFKCKCYGKYFFTIICMVSLIHHVKIFKLNLLLQNGTNMVFGMREFGFA